MPTPVAQIIQTLLVKGFEAYPVGGCVRDLLLGKSPTDWDITTSATPDQVTPLFEKVVPTGLEFGTVTVLIDGVAYEVTTYRAEERYSDGRHPDSVRFGKTLEEDLSRRDFTVNAMAFDVEKNNVIDPFEGQKDLQAKLIRCVGDPVKRFSEDGLRSIRACRFAAKLGFKIEPKTLAAVSETLDTTKKVAVERIKDEMNKMMEADKPSIGIEYMRETGLLEFILPELMQTIGVEQPKPFHLYDVYGHSIRACDAAPNNDRMVRLAALFHDIGKPKCKEGDTFYGHDRVGAEITINLMRRLKFSNAEIDRVSLLVREHMFHYLPEWTDSAVRRFIKRVGEENIEPLFLVRKADVAGMEREVTDVELAPFRTRIQKVFDEDQALHVKQLKVDGNDVMKVLGIPPGQKVGEILNALMEDVLEDPRENDHDKLLARIRNYGEK